MTFEELRAKLRVSLRRGAPVIAPPLVVLAGVSTGLAIGWSTGQAGLDSDVLAAVLPVILTSVAGGAGTAVIWIARNRPKNPGEFGDAERRLAILASVTVIAFSAAYLVGTVVGKNVNEQARLQKEYGILETSYDYLVRCTGQLVRLNKLRKEARYDNADLNLEPLILDQVCIGLARRASSERPLVALVDDGGFLPPSPDMEKRHYEFLETCTLDQAAAISGDQTPVTIGQVCPALVADRPASH